VIPVPDALIASHSGPAGRVWLAGLPGLVGDFLDRWGLRQDGPTRNGMASLVVPVTGVDGARAVLRCQPPGEETTAAVIGLRTWGGDGVVRLLDHDPDLGVMLLERLDPDRSLSAVPDDEEAQRLLAGLLARLTAVPAPPGLSGLGEVAAAMLRDVPDALPRLSDDAERALVRTCAAAVAEVLDAPGDRLLHWDLHYDNVLAGEREPWLAIDPVPLAGDPGFDLWPALDSRWDAVVGSGDVPRAVVRRFDLLTEALELDRERAAAWTLGRVLQNALWDVEDGKHRLEPAQVAVAAALLGR